MKRLLLLAILASTAVAQADSGSLPNGATLAFTMKTWLHEQNSKANKLPVQDPTSTWEYFNLAHCQCSQFNYNDPNATLGMPWYEGSFNPEIQFVQGSPPISQAVDVWTGASCDVDTSRPLMCHQVATGITDVSSIAAMGGLTTIPVPLYDLMAPVPDTSGARTCGGTTTSGTVWLLAKTMGGAYDYNITHTYNIDMLPPFSPTEYTVSGAENAIEIDFKPTTNNPIDIAYYQALCATEGDAPAFTKPPFEPRYQTGYTLCNAQANITFQPVLLDANGHGTLNQVGLPVDAGVDALFAPLAGSGSGSGSGSAVDAGVDAPMGTGPDASEGTVDISVLAQADKMFVCGENPSATATSLRIKNLQNGVKYKVVLLTIDKAGNAAGVYFNQLMAPKPVTDFWEDLHDQGSHVQGGFCLISAAYGDDNPLTNLMRGFRDDTLGGSSFGRLLTRAYYATLAKLGPVVARHLALRILAGILLLPFVLLALLWHFVTLPGIAVLVVLAVLMRRRALRMRLAQVGSVALVLLVASRAHAQSPYWEDQTHTQPTDDDTALNEIPLVNWHVGVRAGPYVPQIDAQLGVYNNGKGPYQAMFGGYSILPMIDVDRVLWRRVGQLGVGLSAGYMGKSAHAWADMSSPTDPNRPRSSGDTNSFRLIPITASAVYRFTYLDDEYGIPLVPYARAGLAYYVWWINATHNLAQVCNGDGMEPDCSQNKAIGASLGVVGSIGLAIRAERIDESAARSMRESGIEHAGFFGELSMGKVDGFGSDKKLAVGDTTWFAGVEFEF